MKKLLLFVFLFMMFSNAFAAPDTTGTPQKNQDTTAQKKSDSSDKVKKNNATAMPGDSTNNPQKKEVKCAACLDNKVSGWDWVLIFLPAIMFVLLFVLLLFIGLGNFNLKEAMSENDYPKITRINEAYKDKLVDLKDTQNLQEVLPPTIEVSYVNEESIQQQDGKVILKEKPPEPHASISRYIAFITSILTLIIAMGISCFFIYYYIRCGIAPDISGISTILIALGMGILPYAFNKVSGAIAANREKQ